MGAHYPEMNAHEAAAPPQEPRGFALMFAASLILAAINFTWGVVIDSVWDTFPNLMNRLGDAHPAFGFSLIMIYVYGTAGLWVASAGFAYRNYGRKWPWFLLGSPFALFYPVLMFPLVICSLKHLIYNYPGPCGFE